MSSYRRLAKATFRLLPALQCLLRRIARKVKKKGAGTIPAKKLLEFVRLLPEEEIRFNASVSGLATHSFRGAVGIVASESRDSPSIDLLESRPHEPLQRVVIKAGQADSPHQRAHKYQDR